jgi:hypothetical protein
MVAEAAAFCELSHVCLHEKFEQVNQAAEARFSFA